MNVVPLATTSLRLSAHAASESAQNPLDISAQLLELLPVAVYVCDRDGTILRYNRRAAELWGREPSLGDPRERFCGSLRMYRLDGTPLPHDQCPMGDVLRTGLPVRDQEVGIERPDGTRIVALVNIDALRDATGTIVGAVNAFQDITERKRLEMEREAQERRHRELLDALPVAVYTTDAEGRITYFNKAAVTFSGRQPVLGRDDWCVTWRLYHPNGEPMSHEQCPMAVALREQREIRGEEAIAERPDGTRVRFTPYPTPLYDNSGKLIGAVNTLVDISERENAKKHERLLAAIVESSDDAIIARDLNGTILSWNAGAERIFGYTAAEALGKAITLIIPEDRQDEEPSILQHIRRGGRIEHYETVRRHKDGHLVDISLTVSPIKGSDGTVVGASKISRDITERKRALEQQKLLLREMAHRIANLFTVTQGIVALSARFAETPAELARTIQDRLDALIRAQELTRPGLTGYAMDDTTLRALLQVLVAPYVDRRQRRDRLTLRGLDLPIKRSAVASIALVLHEFATNAAKYGALSAPDGMVTVEWWVDNDILSLVWQERGGPSVTMTPRHQGFGSILARRLVEGQLGGSLSYEWPAEGVTIRCTLPTASLGAVTAAK